MIRLAHFSDIHFSVPPRRILWSQLGRSKRLLGLLSLRMSRYRRLDGAARVAAAMQRDMAERELDGVVFSGDLTCMALPEEYRAARAGLARLCEREDVVGIPGNHDVYVPDARGSFGRHFPDWMRSDLPTERWPSPFVRFFDQVAVVGLQSARPNRPHDSSGIVPTRVLWELDTLLDRPELRQRTVILVLHYGLVRADGSPDKRLHGLRNADELIGLLRGRVSLILHGHMHRAFTVRLPDGACIACPGSVSDRKYAQAYHLLELEDGKLSLQARRYSVETGSFEPWKDAPHTGNFSLVGG